MTPISLSALGRSRFTLLGTLLLAGACTRNDASSHPAAAGIVHPPPSVPQTEPVAAPAVASDAPGAQSEGQSPASDATRQQNDSSGRRPHGTEVIFTGMCDASAAVPLNQSLFVVADDEDNVLRVYDSKSGGAPLSAQDVSNRLALPVKKKKKKSPNKPLEKQPKSPETDIEAATRIGDSAFWLTSHGRNSKGKVKSERFRMFETSATSPGEIEVIGQPYEHLIQDLLADPRFAGFDLAAASELAPKELGGLNIEGMTARFAGGVWIGLRNPTPFGKALVFALLNPEEVVRGQPAQFGEVRLLDLGGYGVRSLSSLHGRYLIIAGHYAGGGPSRLYQWNGADKLEQIETPDLQGINPEGFFTPEGRRQILLLSDDGTQLVDGEECKGLEDPTKKRFRGLWVDIEPLPPAGF